MKKKLTFAIDIDARINPDSPSDMYHGEFQKFKAGCKNNSAQFSFIAADHLINAKLLVFTATV